MNSLIQNVSFQSSLANSTSNQKIILLVSSKVCVWDHLAALIPSIKALLELKISLLQQSLGIRITHFRHFFFKFLLRSNWVLIGKLIRAPNKFTRFTSTFEKKKIPNFQVFGEKLRVKFFPHIWKAKLIFSRPSFKNFLELNFFQKLTFLSFGTKTSFMFYV